MVKKILKCSAILLLVAFTLKTCFFKNIYSFYTSNISSVSFEKQGVYWYSNKPEDIAYINSLIKSSKISFKKINNKQEDVWYISMAHKYGGYKTSYNLYLQETPDKTIISGVNRKPYYLNDEDINKLKTFIRNNVLKK